MKGLAPPDSLTGKVQRALTDEWQTQAQISAKAGIYESKPATVRALLERLCSEGRAEWILYRPTEHSVAIVLWRHLSVSERREREDRQPAGVARPSQRAEGIRASSGDDGNVGAPVAPTPKENA